MTGRAADDDRLLELLGHALEPEPRAPSAASIAALRAQVPDAGLDAPAVATTVHAKRRPLMWAAAAALIAASFAAGVVLSDDLPRPIRGAAHTIGLPVDSNQLVDARAALDRLGQALAAGDVAAVREADATIVRLVKTLDANERAKVEPVAHEVHLRAVELLGP